MQLRLRFATNRNAIGTNPVRGFGDGFSHVHPHNLRFGEVRLSARAPGAIDASRLADRYSAQISAGKAELEVYPEDLDARPQVLGSLRLFDDLKADMDRGVGTVLLIHGYNNTFADAIGTALALQYRVQSLGAKLNVVSYSWPSDGKLTPVIAYRRDREDAATSGLAFSRGFQKLYQYLLTIPSETMCRSPIHLLSHSMGAFVLENTLWHLCRNLPGRLPRIFDQVVLASPDVDSDALEHADELGRLPEISRRVTIYYNREDRALLVSDLTKGNPDRLGTSGPKHPLDAPSGVVNVDCTRVVSGLSEHSYYLDEVSRDLTETLRGKREDAIAHRDYLPSANAYVLRPK